MSVLFIFGSIILIVFLMKCIYNNIEKEQEQNKEPPPPTLEDTLISLIGYFKEHIHQFAIYPDKMVIYCFKNSPQDDVTDFNEMTIRYCDIGFKTIPSDDCKPLQEKLKTIIEDTVSSNVDKNQSE